MPSTPQPVPAAGPVLSPPSGVVYVGPSLGRSLAGLVAAVLLPSERAPRP